MAGGRDYNLWSCRVQSGVLSVWVSVRPVSVRLGWLVGFYYFQSPAYVRACFGNSGEEAAKGGDEVMMKLLFIIIILYIYSTYSIHLISR